MAGSPGCAAERQYGFARFAAAAAGSGTGAFFLTPQDSTLRFLDSALLQEAGKGYADSASALRFAGFGESQHGRVWRDANGDIRFEAEPGFVGTASFLYQVQTSQGEIITRRALVTSGFN